MAPRRTRPTTAALYCRLSRRPDDGKVMTVAEQETALRAEAARRGLSVVGSFADNGVSAYRRANRPGFAELLATLDAGGVGYVLVVALDRASRRVGDVAMLRDALEDAGALLVADGREYDPHDDALSIYLTGIVGEQESRDKSRRVLAAKEQALSRGLYNGGRRPFGYEKPAGSARGYWVQNPEEASAIRAGAKRVMAGASLATVAADWNARGIDRPMTAGPWTASKVRRALLSPIVAGQRTHKGEVVGTLMRPDGSAWPAIITPAQRDAIDRALRGRYGRRPMRGWHTPNPALLSGLIVCGACGHNLTPRRYGGRRADGYTCQADGGGRCGTIGITLAKVDELVTEAVLHALDTPKMRKALTRPRKVRTGEDPASVQAEMEELAAAAGRGEIQVREYLAARGPLDERLQRALADLDVDDTAVALAPMLDGDPRSAWNGLDLDGRRSVLGAVLDRVTVGPSNGQRGVFDPGRVGIVWKV